MADNILTKIKKALSDENFSYESEEQLFSSLGITQGFEAAYEHFALKERVVLMFELTDIVNCY